MKTLSLSAAILCLCAVQAHAASVYLSPPSKTVPITDGTTSFELMMDFTVAEATLGGGIDIDLRGPISVLSFVPSTYFTTAADPAFSGHGTARADNDYEIHFGNFNGMSGKNLLGVFTVNLLNTGEADLRLGINSFWGNFYSTGSVQQNVALIGSNLTITAVPEPTSVAMWLAGTAMLGAAAKRRRGDVSPLRA